MGKKQTVSLRFQSLALVDFTWGIADGGGNDGAATVASAVVVMTTFFRNVPGLVRDVTRRRRRVAAVPRRQRGEKGFSIVVDGQRWRHCVLDASSRWQPCNYRECSGPRRGWHDIARFMRH